MQEGSASALSVRHGPRADILTWTKKRLFLRWHRRRRRKVFPSGLHRVAPTTTSRLALQRPLPFISSLQCTTAVPYAHNDQAPGTKNDLTSNGVSCAPASFLSTIGFTSLEIGFVLSSLFVRRRSANRRANEPAYGR